MRKMSATRFSALMGFLGVALGAFGAHWLKSVLVENHAMSIWQTAVLYHLVHSVAALAMAEKRPLASWILSIGIVLFSGSLYALALTHQQWLAFITPVGGICFLAGWAMCFKKIK